MRRDASLLGQLLGLAWPIVLARATQSVVGFSDALMVSPLGEAPLAGVTTGALNTFSLVILPMGTAFILQSFAAQLRGRGDLGGVRRYALYGLGIALGAALLGLLTIPLLSPVIGSLGYAPDVREAMTAYMAIRLLSVGPVVASEALGNWYGGLGNTRVAMITGTLTMIGNVGLNWLLIEPRLGLPGYGVAGAAWASVSASTLGFAVVLAMFARGFGVDRAILEGPRGRLRASELARVLKFGLPNGVNWFLEFSAFIVFINVVVAHLGTSVVAAFNVVMQINSISFMPAFGLSSAGAILVGEAIGKGAHDDVARILRRTAIVACGWMGAASVVYFLAPASLIGLFTPRGEGGGELLAVGTVMLMASALWQILDGLGMTIAEALRAAGDTTWCMVARLTLAWAIFTPGAYVAVVVMGGGPLVVMGAVIAYIALIAATMAFRFKSGRWRTIEMIEPSLVSA